MSQCKFKASKMEYNKAKEISEIVSMIESIERRLAHFNKTQGICEVYFKGHDVNEGGFVFSVTKDWDKDLVAKLREIVVEAMESDIAELKNKLKNL